jgi:carbamoyl-phosphate synthase small subunit
MIPGKFDLPALLARRSGGRALKAGSGQGRVAQGQELGRLGLASGQGYGRPHDPRPHVVAIDFGAKDNIFRNLVPPRSGDGRACADLAGGFWFEARWCVPVERPGRSGGDGRYAVPVIKGAAGTRRAALRHLPWSPDAGLAAGAKTIKMHQGHRGANHPVKRTAEGVVEITSMNHGFAVDADAARGRGGNPCVAVRRFELRCRDHRQKPSRCSITPKPRRVRWTASTFSRNFIESLA